MNKNKNKYNYNTVYIENPNNKNELFNLIRQQMKNIYFDNIIEQSLKQIFKELLKQDNYYDYLDKYKNNLSSLDYYYSIRNNIETSLYVSFNHKEYLKFNINKNDVNNLIDNIMIDNFENFKNKFINILTID